VQEAVALADRILLIEEGRIALDQRVPLTRPRERASTAFAQLEERVLQRVMKTPAAEHFAAFDAHAPGVHAREFRWAL
jgi:sulfonate transport system ATP-binding protein